MNGSFSSEWFGKAGESSPLTAAPAALFEAFEQLRSGFEQRLNPRVAKGDVRAAILALLAEQPMHGYQIIQEIQERSGGSWKPSPGSVYPALQLLADEGLVSTTEADGRKTYALTEAGRDSLGDEARPAPWESASEAPNRAPFGDLPKAGSKLAHAVAQVGRDGSPAQVAEAVEVLNEARRKLYAILAQE